MTEPSRRLPGHIESALEQQKARISAGENLTDTAGQPWAGRSFEHSMPADPQDDGTADPRLMEVLDQWSQRQAGESDVVRALAEVRLFVAARAEHADADDADPAHQHIDHEHSDNDHAHGDKAADMVLSSLTAPDGRKAIPVFTSADAVTAWAPDARPIPFDARRVALSCVQDGASLLVIDPGPGSNFIVRRPAVWAIAKGEPWEPSYASAAVQAALDAVSLRLPNIAALRSARGPRANAVSSAGEMLDGGGLGPELVCEVFIPAGLTREQLSAEMERVSAALAADQTIVDSADSLSLKIRPATDLHATTAG